MRLTDRDSDVLKKWIVARLETISDADSDVLGDYVLALVKTDDPEPIAKANCVANLRDFLNKDARSFVDEVFNVIHTNASDTTRAALKPTAPTFQPSKGRNQDFLPQQNERRKRRHDDLEDHIANGKNSLFSGTRPSKHARRDGRSDFDRPRLAALHPPPLPKFPPGVPSFYPQDPLAALVAFHHAMGLPAPVPSLPMAMNGPSLARSGLRCKDYDTKGFCASGVSCPYEHGSDPCVVPWQSAEYDPTNAAMLDMSKVIESDSREPPSVIRRGGDSHRGRRSGSRGGGKRADFSLVGPNRDRSNTSLVIEQIPEGKFSEESVREFFVTFGNIEKVELRPYRRIAIVKYDNYDSARAAYESPKAVFDSRFVKVYWYKVDKLPRNGHGGASTSTRTETETADAEMQELPVFDAEEFAKRQAEAQRKHDEAKRRREEVGKRKQALDERISSIEQERRKMEELIAEKTGTPVPQESEQTKALKAQLAALEAEAKSLGIDPNSDNVESHHNAYPPVYRGRGGFRGRARGWRGQRGSYRGSYDGLPRRAAVMRLDNRPKTVKVTFTEGSYADHEEAIRSYLLLADLETASVTKHIDSDAAALVTFEQRFEGENFITAMRGGQVKGLKNAELSWSSNSADDQSLANGHRQDAETHSDAVEASVARGEEHEAGTDHKVPLDDEDLDRWGG